MKIEPLVLDGAQPARGATQPSLFAHILDDLGATLEHAQGAENAYASGSGSLQSAVYERARADIALSVAVAAASRTTQSLQTILNMQV